ncbi:CBN-IFTA-2 protein [Caenorhabditis brenneri]|uniref:CBN-IFTA-2 protein n=1 Tax=Caenorhabditis brenneri TaxID=135651 RepID=G0MRC5_CAEBE|nr:CBN-IFTA-2 protein [Caenorhabditis brenneri]
MQSDIYDNKKIAKILVLGPPKAGKTTLCRFLADFMEESEGSKKGEDPAERERKFEFEFTTTYMPTKAARIQEFETHEFFQDAEHETRRLQDSEIHLWDVSGDRKYEDCWPAIKENVEGVILVANPEEHKGKDLQLWYTEFVEKENINLNCVMVILNEQGSKKTNHEQISSFEILPQLRTVHHVAHHFGSESMQMKQEVNAFMASVLRVDQRRAEMAESHGLSYEEAPEEDEF